MSNMFLCLLVSALGMPSVRATWPLTARDCDVIFQVKDRLGKVCVYTVVSSDQQATVDCKEGTVSGHSSRQ